MVGRRAAPSVLITSQCSCYSGHIQKCRIAAAHGWRRWLNGSWTTVKRLVVNCYTTKWTNFVSSSSPYWATSANVVIVTAVKSLHKHTQSSLYDVTADRLNSVKVKGYDKLNFIESRLRNIDTLNLTAILEQDFSLKLTRFLTKVKGSFFNTYQNLTGRVW